jgi:hypothetical protein
MTCAICPRPLPEADADRYACAACEHQLRAWLAQLSTEIVLLRAELTPGRGPGGGRPAGRAHAPIPLDVRVLDLLGRTTGGYVPDPHGQDSAGIPIGPLLTGWAHRIAREHPAAYRRYGTEYSVPCRYAAPRRGSDLTAWCRWLAAYLPHALRQPWIRDMHDEIGEAVRRVSAVTGTRPRRHRYLAPCPACQGFAMSRTDGQWEYQCDLCGHRLDPDQYAEHAAAVLPGLTAMAVRMATAELTNQPT